MKIKVRLFSVARELAGFREQELELSDGARAGDVFEVLKRMNNRFSDWEAATRLAVNQEYVSGDHRLRDGDDVAVIPPVSGG